MTPLNTFDRRTLIQGLALACVAHHIPAHAYSGGLGGFELETQQPPVNPQLSPAPATPRPEGSGDSIFDIFGNHWCLGPPDERGYRDLLVLPAQAPQQWLPDEISSLPSAPWKFVGADESGFLWVASSNRCMRLDPHTAETGWKDFSTEIFKQPTDEAVTAIGVGPNGAIMLAFASGGLVEIDCSAATRITHTDSPAGADNIVCDDAGKLWLRCGTRTYSRPPAPDAWQHQWELVARLPAGNHDLSGDVLNGHFYMGGGQNAGWGYPAKAHIFRELYEYDPVGRSWRVAGTLQQPRFYNGTSCLDGKVWVIGGSKRDAIGNPVLLTSVEIFDPMTGASLPGPPLPTAMANPVALLVNDRIHVAAFAKMDAFEHPCLLYSIGRKENSWRREPSGPSYKTAMSGTALGGRLYLALGGKGLGCFDTRSNSWSLIPYAGSARSPEIAAYRDEIWVMGGRDIEIAQRIVIYTPDTGLWREGPKLPRQLSWGTAVTVGGRLMLVGGAGGPSYNNRTFLLRS